MRFITRKNAAYTVILIVIGVVINRVINTLAGAVGLPLYLDSIGTMFAAVVGGLFPGMFVGFITNMLGGLSDTSTFYYGTINVLIALIAGVAADRGYFNKFYKVFALIPFYLLLSVPCSFLTYILFEFQVGDNVASDTVNRFCAMGLPVLAAQILGDFCIELPDKMISLIAAFILVKLVPQNIRHEFIVLSGRDVVRQSIEEKGGRSSLKRQVALVLFFSGLAIVMVAFAISYKTYMEARVAGYPTDAYDIHQLRVETMLYSGKMLSAVLGLLMCIVSFSIQLADQMVVTPLLKMTREMRHFAYDNDAGRDESVAKIQSLDITTQNEIEELYEAIAKTVKDIDEYIDMTNEQSKTISDLHINIITTLADIVESRDETTGNHVKRTAEYCALLAEKLRSEGKYTDVLTDEYINILTIAAPLHDIGKIKIPDAILNKPGRLTEEEFDVIKTHTTLGGEMLKDAAHNLGETEYLRMAKDIATYHHEWFDGGKRGYPKGIAGNDIPLSARIMAVADVLDALLSKRPYKDGYSLDKALEIMAEEKGTHFDPDVMDALEGSRREIEDIVERYARQS